MGNVGVFIEDLVIRRCEYCDGTGKEDIGEYIVRFGRCTNCRGTASPGPQVRKHSGYPDVLPIVLPVLTSWP